MKYILDSKQMKQVDDLTINRFGIPSMVLMERAALCVADLIESKFSKKSRIVSICGGGNNGADGIAAARILFERDYDVTVILLADNGTVECEKQISIAKKSGVKIKKYNQKKADFNQYDIIIDAIFGIGLSRDIEGSFIELIEAVNKSIEAKVISVDIPSGINATTGQMMKSAIKADYTVTFGYRKTGLMLYPGADYAGNIKVSDIGFPGAVEEKISKKAFTFTEKDLNCIPKRKKNTNKGQYGKVLVIAGSKDMGGAACLAGLSAYKSGSGLVKILTHEANKEVVLKAVPEALITTYADEYETSQLEELILSELEWASCVIIGPGLSKSEAAVILTKNVIRHSFAPVIIDADALNILADIINDKDDSNSIFENSNAAPLILTPHIGEMERISGIDKATLKADPIVHAETFVKTFMKKYARRNEVICVMKDARTIVADAYGCPFINNSGNSGMAKGGSGDVLTGVIAGLIVNGLPCFKAACMGVYIHGLAGDVSAHKKGEYGMRASDIIDNICEVMK